MPVSRTRKKNHKKANAQLSGGSATSNEEKQTPKRLPGNNPAWLLPTILALLIIGLLWIVVFYITSGSSRLPIPALGQWNVLIGFVFMVFGVGLTTKWQ